MSDREVDALFLVAALAGVTLAAILVDYARSRPASLLHWPAVTVHRIASGIGGMVRALWPLWAIFAAMLMFSQCQADAYRRGYEAHQEQCWVDLKSCRFPR